MTVPAKILLKSTTKMSLNERFSRLPAPPSTQAVRVQAATETQASAKNRRLAMQMENRISSNAPAGQQTVRLQPMASVNLQPQQAKEPQTIPIRQRLGRLNVKARLSLPPPNLGRGNVAQRGGRGFIQQQRGILRGRGKFVQRLGRGVNQGVRSENRGGQFYARRGFGVNTRGVNTRGGATNRMMRGRGAIRRGNRGGNRGGGRFMGRGRGRGGRVTTEQLDNQLDDYMSKTKTHLDAQLDAYMNDADA